MKTDECVTSIIKQLTDDIREKIKRCEDYKKRRYKVLDYLKDESISHKAFMALSTEKEILDEEIVRLEYERNMLEYARETCFTAATLYEIKIGEI